MTTIRKKPIIRVELEGHCPTMSLTEVRVRKHSFVIDEPPYRHGTDVGPTPLATMLGALIGCTHVISKRIAHEKNIDLKISRIGCIGHLDHRGIDMEADVPVPFPKIELVIEGTTSGSADEMISLRRELKIRCPMSVILTQAGTIIEESWSLKQSPAEALSGSHA
ncbi:MAG: putative redox protein regulator of disulfide bond formation [Hyphomicrobiales bacterium]|nr:putative redox protein regulator of disulfide bond formation [Hyphomicrobiales bacterium]